MKTYITIVCFAVGICICFLLETSAMAAERGTVRQGCQTNEGQVAGRVGARARLTQNTYNYGGMHPSSEGTDASVHTGSSPFLHEIPLENEFFVDRKTAENRSYLEEMSHILGGDSSPPRSSKKVVLMGMEGIGKKQLAFAYAWKNFNEGKYSFVGHIASDTPEKLMESYISLARILSPGDNASTVSSTALLKDKLSSGYGRKPWLLIYSGAQPEKFLLNNLLPSGGHIIVLSSLTGWEGGGFSHVLPIGGFSPTESVNFLFRKTRIANNSGNTNEAHLLASSLHFYPLALNFAALELLRVKSFSEYSKRFQTAMSNTRALHPGGQGELQKILRTAFSVMQANLVNTIDGHDAFCQETIQLLRYIYYFQADRVPLYIEVFTKNGEEALQALERCHLLSVNRGKRSVSMHPLVQAIGRQENASNKESDLRAIFDHMQAYWNRKLGRSVGQSTWTRIVSQPRIFIDNPHLFGEICVSYQNLLNMESYATSELLKARYEVLKNFIDEIKDGLYSLLIREKFNGASNEKKLEDLVRDMNTYYSMEGMPDAILEWAKLVEPLIPNESFNVYFSLIKQLETVSKRDFVEATSIVHATLLLEKVKKTYNGTEYLWLF